MVSISGPCLLFSTPTNLLCSCQVKSWQWLGPVTDSYCQSLSMRVQTDSVSKTMSSVQNNWPSTMSGHPVTLVYHNIATALLNWKYHMFSFTILAHAFHKHQNIFCCFYHHRPRTCLLHHMLFSNIKFFGSTMNKISGNVFFWLVFLFYSHNEQSVHFFLVCTADPSSAAKAYQNSLLINKNSICPHHHWCQFTGIQIIPATYTHSEELKPNKWMAYRKTYSIHNMERQKVAW